MPYGKYSKGRRCFRGKLKTDVKLTWEDGEIELEAKPNNTCENKESLHNATDSIANMLLVGHQSIPNVTKLANYHRLINI